MWLRGALGHPGDAFIPAAGAGVPARVRGISIDLSDPESVNLSSLAFWELPEEEQEQGFALLRRESPIAEMPPIEDDLAAIPQDNPTGYRAITRYDDIKRISRDPQTLLVRRRRGAGDVAPELLEATLSFIAMDAPRHTKLRGLVSSAFTPRQVARIEEGIRQAAKEIVAEAAPTGGGDFVALIAKRLPLQTISDMIGVPDADRERIVDAADTIVSVGDEQFLGGREPMAALGEAIWTLSQSASEMAAHREEHPERRPDDRARPGGDRRGAAHARRDLGLVRAAVRRRQRHHPAHHLARDARAHAAPRPAGATAGGPGCAAAGGGRGVRALGHAGACTSGGPSGSRRSFTARRSSPARRS